MTKIFVRSLICKTIIKFDKTFAKHHRESSCHVLLCLVLIVLQKIRDRKIQKEPVLALETENS